MFEKTEEGKWREHRSVRIERKGKDSLCVFPHNSHWDSQSLCSARKGNVYVFVHS